MKPKDIFLSEEPYEEFYPEEEVEEDEEPAECSHESTINGFCEECGTYYPSDNEVYEMEAP